MIKKKHFIAENLKIFIIDEADEMLSSGSNQQIEEIFKFLPEDI